MEDRLVVALAYERTELLDLASATSPFAFTSTLAGGGHVTPPYRIVVATPGGNPIECDSGIPVLAHAALERLKGPIDTLIISGGLGAMDAAADEHLVAHVRRLANESRRVASVCTGAWILAATGLLDGREATTHWAVAKKFASAYPKITVYPSRVFIRHGKFATSAGVTCGLDLAMALIEEDFGPRVSQDVARTTVAYRRRSGAESQSSMYTVVAPRHNVVREVTDYIVTNLNADLSTSALARKVQLSERQLERLFLKDDTRCTPQQYVIESRLLAAREFLETTDLTLDAIAARCGYSSGNSLREAIIRKFGRRPKELRSVARSTVEAGTAPGGGHDHLEAVTM